MKCELFRPLLPADLGQLLEGAEADELRAHLAECADCAAEREALAAAFDAAAKRSSRRPSDQTQGQPVRRTPPPGGASRTSES